MFSCEFWEIFKYTFLHRTKGGCSYSLHFQSCNQQYSESDFISSNDSEIAFQKALFSQYFISVTPKNVFRGNIEIEYCAKMV